MIDPPSSADRGATGAAAPLYGFTRPQARRRARITALVGAAQAIGPVAMVIALVYRFGYASGRSVAAAALALSALGALRVSVVHRRARVQLERLRIETDAERLRVRLDDGGASLDIGRADIARITEVEGPLGGLRLGLSPSARLPARVDIPRGGHGWDELRASVARLQPVAWSVRRRRVPRRAVIAVALVAIVFMPFIIDDFAEQARWAAPALVVALWALARLVTSRP